MRTNNNSGHSGPLSNLRVYYDLYIKNGYKTVLSAGKHPGKNEEMKKAKAENREPNDAEVYRSSKKPLEKNWENKSNHPFEVVEAHVNAGGTLSVIPPESCVALDIDVGKDTTSAEYEANIKIFYHVLARHGIEKKVGIHKTKNGIHAIFSVPDASVFQSLKSANKDNFLKCGIKVTYRCGVGSDSIANIVAAPSNGREWSNFVETESLAVIPDEFLPLAKSPSFDEISALLAREIYHYYKAGVIAGSADIDLSFMGYCANFLKMTVQDVERLWEAIYRDEYKENDTRAIYARTVSMAANGEPTTGGGKWRESLANRDLIGVEKLTDLFCKKWRGDHVDMFTPSDQKKSRCVINNEWAVEYVKKHKLICYNGGYYFFNNRYYEGVDVEKIEKHINEFLGNEFTPVQKKNILEKVRLESLVTEKDLKVEPAELCLLNGVYNVENHTIIPHSPKKIFFGCFDFNYYIGITPEPNGFDKFFDELFPRAEHQAAKETYLKYMAYGLSGLTHFHLGLIMESEGRSGKSESQKFFRGIFPTADYAEFQELSHLYGDFKNEELEHARVVYVDDADKSSRFNEGCLKTIIQGGKILINPKSRKPFKITNRSKIIVGTNKDNNFLDSHGIGDLERWVVINFPMTFTEERGNVIRDKHKELLASQEIKDRAGYVLVENLRVILKSGKFDVPASIRASSREKLQKGNWYYQFAKNHLYYANNINGSVAKSDIYKIAVAWALSQGHKGTSAQNFWVEIKRAAKCGSLFDIPVKNGGMYKKNGIDHLCGIAIMGLEVLKLEDGKTVKAVYETAIPNFDDEKHGPISIADMNYNDYLLEKERRVNLVVSTPEVEAVGAEIAKVYKIQDYAGTATADDLKKEVVEKVRLCKNIISEGKKTPEQFNNVVIGNLKLKHKIGHLKDFDDVESYVNKPKIDLPWHLENIKAELDLFIGPAFGAGKANVS